MWRDAAWVLDMLNACRRVMEYARGLTEEGFLASPRDQDAILRQLTIAGEAAKNVSADFRASHPEVPWKKVAGFRDVAVHGYFRVDLKEVWRIVQQDVPPLIAVGAARSAGSGITVMSALLFTFPRRASLLCLSTRSKEAICSRLTPEACCVLPSPRLDVWR